MDLQLLAAPSLAAPSLAVPALALWLAVASLSSGCSAAAPAQAPPGEVARPLPSSAPSAPSAPASPAAPPGVEREGAATRAAHARLVRLLEELSSREAFALGHQDTTAYGVGWSDEVDRSDVESVCGSHVAVHGWDVFGIEKGATRNGDGVDFENMRRLIASAHRRGAINTISWHLDNPVSGKNAWDRTPAVRQILPGQPRHALYEAQLDRLATFLESLRGDSGERIPIIFRPFHEHSASWFWWGGANTNRRDYVALWRHTVDYLRHRRGLDHLLFAFSPAAGDVYSEASYLHRYPGDEYVDVFGVDHYYERAGSKLVRVLEIVVRAAEARGKIPALTEFGAQDGLSSGVGARWLLTDFLHPLRESPLAARIAYALAWRNASESHCFLPYPGHPGAPALAALCADERVLLQSDVASLPSAGEGPLAGAPAGAHRRGPGTSAHTTFPPPINPPAAR